MTVLDASALLAFLHGESGAETVEEVLSKAVVSAANWSETCQKVTSRGVDWDIAGALLTSYGVRVEPVTEADTEAAAFLWRPGSGLSLGDRLCLATGQRLGAPVMTADKVWGSSDTVIQIR